MKTLVVKCNNKKIHKYEDREPGEGNVLFFVKDDCIFVKCSDHRCSYWNKIRIRIPGTKINLSNAVFEQKAMSRKYSFNAEKAVVVIEDN